MGFGVWFVVSRYNRACHRHIITYMPMGHVNEYATMHYFGNPKHSQSMIAYMILNEYLLNFQ